MKRIFFALATVALLLPGPSPAHAGGEVSVDFFYNNLGEDGNWVDVDDYGYCWQPNVAVSNRDWRPYSDGYWAYTDVGWTWVSYEDFGWATYHYGRWARVRDHGWLWVPGREWGPAWVSWRTGGDYVGWAPLPPRRYSSGEDEVVYEGRPIGVQVDIDFDIGPSYYNFVDVRYIGEPVLRERIFEPSQNITYVNNTVNVTNITYNNSTVYNYGPDYNRLSAYSTRPIQRLALQRETSVDLNAAARSGSMTRVQGNTLMVAAPQQLHKPAQPVAPKVVKQKIAKPDLETGWTSVSDPKAKADLQQKMKKEDPKAIPATKLQPHNPAALTAASPALIKPIAPAAGPVSSIKAPPAASMAPPIPDKDKGPEKNATQLGQSPAPIAPMAAPVVSKGSEKTRGNQIKPLVTPGPKVSPSDVLTSAPAGKMEDKIGKGPRVNPPAPAKTTSPTIASPGSVPKPIAQPMEKVARGAQKKEAALAVPPKVAIRENPSVRKAPPQIAVPPPAANNNAAQSKAMSERAKMPASMPAPKAMNTWPPPPKGAAVMRPPPPPPKMAPQPAPVRAPAPVAAPPGQGKAAPAKVQTKKGEPPASPAPDR